MTIEELHGIVVEGFRTVDDRFARIDDRFARVDDRFARIDERFDEIRQEMREFRAAIETRLHEQDETTHRHFDVMVERVEAAVRIVAEGHGHLRTVADNHEARLQAIEKRL